MKLNIDEFKKCATYKDTENALLTVFSDDTMLIFFCNDARKYELFTNVATFVNTNDYDTMTHELYAYLVVVVRDDD